MSRQNSGRPLNIYGSQIGYGDAGVTKPPGYYDSASNNPPKVKGKMYFRFYNFIWHNYLVI